MTLTMPQESAAIFRDALVLEHDGIQFDVIGVPVPQGSKDYRVAKGGRYAYGYEANPDLKAWRAQVVQAARWTMRARPTWDCPMGCHIDFWFPRTTNTRKHEVYKATPPDIDKLTRAIHDALKIGGVVTDDGRFAQDSHLCRYVPHVRPKDTPQPPGVRVSVIPLDHTDPLEVVWPRSTTKVPTWDPQPPATTRRTRP